MSRRAANRTGKQIHPLTLEYAAYVFIVTNSTAEIASPAEVLERYRLRWQIEIAFKRFKRIPQLDALRAKDRSRPCPSRLPPPPNEKGPPPAGPYGTLHAGPSLRYSLWRLAPTHSVVGSARMGGLLRLALFVCIYLGSGCREDLRDGGL